MNYKEIRHKGKSIFVDVDARLKKCFKCNKMILFGSCGNKRVPLAKENGRLKPHYHHTREEAEMIGAKRGVYNKEKETEKNQEFLNNL